MLFRKKSKPERLQYDPEVRRPALRCSICTGERVAGFKNLQTGKFEDHELIRTEEELEAFKQACGVETLMVIY